MAGTEASTPIWCIAANVVETRPYGPGGVETRRGLRLFGPGAKVWVPTGYGGAGYDTVVVIGRTRNSHRWSTVAVQSRHLTNWRVKLVYSPAVLARIAAECETSGGRGFAITAGPDTDAYREGLEQMVAALQRQSAQTHPEPGRHRVWRSFTARLLRH